MSIYNYLKLLRPKHWVKNFFVLAPIVFAGKVSDAFSIKMALLVFVSFCLGSSAVYVLNDIKDWKQDEKHPIKKNRPIASGVISVALASIYCAALFLAFIALSSVWIILKEPIVFLLLMIYAVLNIFYTYKLKQIELLDAFIIAIGFVLRIIAGAYAIAVTPTGWIIVTTFFLSLFLGFGKRRNEILQMEDNAAEHRQVLSKYNIALLDQIIVSTGTIAIISYALYTLDAGVVAKFGTDKLYYTIPFVAYGVFRYILVLFKGEKSDPTEIVTSDYEIILDVVLWLITAYAIVYFSGGQFR